MRLSLVLVVIGAGCVVQAGGDAVDSGSSGAGVESTSDGASSTTTGGPYTGSCEETPTVVTDPQHVGLTGVSATEVLAEVEGVYTGTLAWQADTPASYQGSALPTVLTLELRYDGGEIRDVDAVLVHPCEHDGPCPCDDSLEVDVTWHLTSADGVLDETWVAPVVHQPSSWFGGGPLRISHDFQPDDTTGSLAASSFALDDGWVLRKLVAAADLGAGSAQGSIATEIEMLGGIGYGPAATFAAVREVTDESCHAIEGETACGWAGCTPVEGQRVYGAPPACGCNGPELFCFAAPLVGEAEPTIYVQTLAEGPDSYDDAVLFPTLVDPPPAPWRACASEPDVASCACTPTCE